MSLPLIAYASSPIPLESGTRVFIGAVAVGLLLTAVWSVALGRDRGAAAASVTILGLVIATEPAKVLLVAAALVLLVIEAVWSRRGTMQLHVPWRRITSVMTTVLAIFLAIQLGRMAWIRLPGESQPVPAAWSVPAGTGAPDIFVIIADGRGRSDVLRERYGYDDTAFREAMLAAGLEPSDASFANHSTTRFSLPVLLNGRPLSELGQDLAAPASDDIAYRATEHNSLFDMLNRAGYATTVIGSGYDHVPLRNVDRYIDTGPRNESEQALMRSAMIGVVIDRLTNLWVTDQVERVDRQLAELGAIAAAPSDGPEFVLVHLPVPHWPIVFEADCSPRPDDPYTAGSNGRGEHAGDDTAVLAQADQTRCVDAKLSEAVEGLVAARPDAVVLVLSDHGVEEGMDWTSPDQQGMHDRLANTFWARTPGRGGLFPADVSLVNVFPILANAYLDTDLPIQPDDRFFGPSQGRPTFSVFSE